MKIFFDGGCRPNPGRMEVAVVAAGQTMIVADAGYGTSSDAEWLALIEAVTIARALGVDGAVLLGDAADVVAKANGAVRCRGEAVHYLERFRALAAGVGRVRHVARSRNLAGIALARRHPR